MAKFGSILDNFKLHWHLSMYTSTKWQPSTDKKQRFNFCPDLIDHPTIQCPIHHHVCEITL